MLNNRQQEVILDNSNELLVLAGAGSGKTHCVTEKIKSLLNNGYNISEIVAITFTNKAADEMIERISKFNYINKMNSNISTFHSFCYKILKDNLNFLGLSNVRICDDNQSTSLLGEAVEIVLETKDGSSRAKQEIEKLKNRLIYPDNIEINKHKWISSIYKEYEKLLKQCSLLDFNDLISKTVLLLKENSLLREKYQKQFKFIIVDEFQDVNNAQFELIRELHNPIYNKLMVVGDDAQSIYSFRSSDPSFIINFKDIYSNSNTIKLEQNYRSTQKILNTANYVINKNEKGIKKELWTNNDNGENIDVIKFNGEKEQANFIANLILKNKDIKKFKDYCILYRINSQSRIIEDALAVRNIPAKVIHGVSFYDRAEVKDIMSYLRFIDNPNDIFSFRRCIQTPKRGIGKKTIDKIIEESKNKSIIEVLQSYNDKVKVFSDFIIKARSMRHDSVELIKFIMLETGYNSYLKEKAKTNEELINRTESIEQIINMSIKETEDKSVQSLLDYMSLRTDNASTDKDDAVRLSTIHSSKGLEFDTVFLISMNQGVFPHESLDTEIEEARRLFYVAVTRAKNKLCITHTMSSVKYGTIIFNKPSLFLSDLPKEGINKIGGSYDFFD
ncbi:MAG: UvrD-helicase domain-containing protein [Methanothrix sp.]|jgi:DNA helicase-2/ATP-dependent DNA helicase PcrA|nr:UvrD-helicase domain-containing protein [Methanothrix sp.]